MEGAVCRPALPPWSEQRQREDYFLGRHATVQERSPVAALILAQLRRIDKETVIRGEQSVTAGAPARQPQHVVLREQQRLVRPLGAKIFAELVAEVGARIPLGIHSRGRVAGGGCG